MTVHAVFENGVFRPLQKVDLPEKCEVTFEPKLTSGQQVHAPAEVIDVRALVPPGTDEGLIRIYECMSRSYETGDPDAAARHDEHQP